MNYNILCFFFRKSESAELCYLLAGNLTDCRLVYKRSILIVSAKLGCGIHLSVVGDYRIAFGMSGTGGVADYDRAVSLIRIVLCDGTADKIDSGAC